VKRVFDVVVALAALIVAAPILLLAAIGIRLSSPGPILFRARRMGRDRRNSSTGKTAPGHERRRSGYGGREFTLYKLRTMRPDTAAAQNPITSDRDPRVFPFGAWLRATKIDELPQVIHVIKGDMTIVGPRPEDPDVVRTYYSEADHETLRVRPGLTSPGSLYYYTHLESKLEPGDNVLRTYVDQVLPVKMSVDREYLRRATFWEDILVVCRTIQVIVGRTIAGRRPTRLSGSRSAPPCRSHGMRETTSKTTKAW